MCATFLVFQQSYCYRRAIPVPFCGAGSVQYSGAVLQVDTIYPVAAIYRDDDGGDGGEICLDHRPIGACGGGSGNGCVEDAVCV